MMIHPGASKGGHWLSETERPIVVTEQRATWQGLGQSQRKIDAAKRTEREGVSGIKPQFFSSSPPLFSCHCFPSVQPNRKSEDEGAY